MNFANQQTEHGWNTQKSRLDEGKEGKSKLSSLENCLETLKIDWKKNKNISSIWHDWPKIVGENLANNCRPINLSHGILIIGASHPQWLQALTYNRHQLLASLRAQGHSIKDLRVQHLHRVSKKKHEDEKELWEKHPSRIDIHGTSTCEICGSPSPLGEIKLWGRCGFCRQKDLSNN